MSQSVSQQEPRGGDVSVNGRKLHYLDWGGDGQPIVILHATGFLGRIYRPIAEALTSIGHVYSYDQRGHGDSEHPKGDVFEWEARVTDLEGFLVAMGLGDVRGFGHSAGGTAIGALASIRPDLISRAVLASRLYFRPKGRSARTTSTGGRSNAGASSTASTRCSRISRRSRHTLRGAVTSCASTASTVHGQTVTANACSNARRMWKQ